MEVKVFTSVTLKSTSRSLISEYTSLLMVVEQATMFYDPNLNIDKMYWAEMKSVKFDLCDLEK